MFGRILPWPGECPDGGFVDLNFAMADLGFTGRVCCVEGVSATKVVVFLLGVNGSKSAKTHKHPVNIDFSRLSSAAEQWFCNLLHNREQVPICSQAQRPQD